MISEWMPPISTSEALNMFFNNQKVPAFQELGRSVIELNENSEIPL